MKRIASLAIAAAPFTFSGAAAAATYSINQIDFVDPFTAAVAPFTQLWGNNNNGKVIGYASFDPTGEHGFAFVYDPATGSFSRIAPPLGVDPENVPAISINDSGDVAGTYFASPGQHGYILPNAGFYSFFSNADPSWPNTEARTISNHTALHPQGLVVGFMYSLDPVTGAFANTTGYLFDPVTSSFNVLPTASPFTIAQGLNVAGQAVGHVTNTTPGAPQFSGFLYTPSGSDPMVGGGTVAMFNINGFPTKARGINDHGILAAAVSDVPGSPTTHVYVGTSLGFQLVDIPSAVGPICASGNGVPGAFPEGLNNAGQITGILTDNTAACATHGFIATPAYVPTGTTPGGAYTFSVDVVPNTPYFLDPAVAVGYDYDLGKKDPRFATVRLPLGIGNNKYVLVVGHKAFDLNAGQLFDFRAHGYKKGVKAFRVACIDPAAQLDPVNSLAFPTEVTFMGAGRFTGTQQPLTRIKYRGRDLATMPQAECRARMLGDADAGGPDTD